MPEKSAKLLFHLSYDFSVASAYLCVLCVKYSVQIINAEATEIRRVHREDQNRYVTDFFGQSPKDRRPKPLGLLPIGVSASCVSVGIVSRNLQLVFY